MKDVVVRYVLTMVFIMLTCDDTPVTLYTVRDSRVSVRTRKLPVWYTNRSEALCYAGDRGIVRTTVTMGMLADVSIERNIWGTSYTLMHGVRRYAQRMARKVSA